MFLSIPIRFQEACRNAGFFVFVLIFFALSDSVYSCPAQLSVVGRAWIGRVVNRLAGPQIDVERMNSRIENGVVLVPTVGSNAEDYLVWISRADPELRKYLIQKFQTPTRIKLGAGRGWMPEWNLLAWKPWNQSVEARQDRQIRKLAREVAEADHGTLDYIVESILVHRLYRRLKERAVIESRMQAAVNLNPVSGSIDQNIRGLSRAQKVAAGTSTAARVGGRVLSGAASILSFAMLIGVVQADQLLAEEIQHQKAISDDVNVQESRARLERATAELKKNIEKLKAADSSK